MKSIDIFCASPASTAICSSMDHRTVIRHGMHRLGDTSYHKSRKSSSARPAETSRKSCTDAADQASPPTSSRYLLSDKPFPDFISDSSQPLIRDDLGYKRLSSSAAFPVNFRSLSTSSFESPLYNPSSVKARKSSSGKTSDHQNAQKSLTAPSNQQIVELRVSIHCKGCEGKLRKHISRMAGVTSFTIDLATKKVTVAGNVTPLGVLTSISKVKNAQFWPSPSPTSSLSPKAS